MGDVCCVVANSSCCSGDGGVLVNLSRDWETHPVHVGTAERSRHADCLVCSQVWWTIGKVGHCGWHQRGEVKGTLLGVLNVLSAWRYDLLSICRRSDCHLLQLCGCFDELIDSGPSHGDTVLVLCRRRRLRHHSIVIPHIRHVSFLEPPLPPSERTVVKHVLCCRIENPVVSFPRPPLLTRELQEAFIEREVVTNAVFPALLVVLSIVGKVVSNKLADFRQSCPFVGEGLDGHGDQCYVGKRRFLWFVRETTGAVEESVREATGGGLRQLLLNCCNCGSLLTSLAVVRVQVRSEARAGERFGGVGDRRVAEIDGSGRSSGVAVHGGVRRVARVECVARVGMRPLHSSSCYFS